MRRGKRIRRASKKIISSKSLRPNTTSEIVEGAGVSNSTRERGTSSPSTKKRNAHSNGDNSPITEHGALSHVTGIVDTTNQDAETESFENDDFCYICDDGGGKLPNSSFKMKCHIIIAHSCCAFILQTLFFATTAQRRFIRIVTFQKYMTFQKENGCAASVVQ